MAREDWEYGDDYWEASEPTPSFEAILFGKDDPSAFDQHAHDLMWEAIVNDNQDAYQELVDYMWDEYDIDFEDAWDWEDFREWYESQ
jgi:hypothetical protein